MRASFVIIFASSLFLSCGSEFSNSELSSDSMTIDLGSISAGIDHESRIHLRNIGSEEIILEEITSDCECTVVPFSRKSIEPGGSLDVKFSFKTMVPGFHQKRITVISNSKVTPRILFIVRARVS